VLEDEEPKETASVTQIHQVTKLEIQQIDTTIWQTDSSLWGYYDLTLLFSKSVSLVNVETYGMHNAGYLHWYNFLVVWLGKILAKHLEFLRSLPLHAGHEVQTV
jgi:hypothetical protein